MIDMTLLGTGATVPLPGRALSAALLSCQGRSILFDCGEGTQTALRREHLSPLKIDFIALSHYHGDHLFGLPGLLQTMGCLGRENPLTLCGPKGLRQVLSLIAALSGPLPFELRLLSLPPEGFPLHQAASGWPQRALLLPVPTEHRVPSQGYCFRLGRAGKFDPEKARALGLPQSLWRALQQGQSVRVRGKEVRPEQVLGPPRPGLSLVFSGDTAPCAALKEAARGADLLVHEATYGGPEQEELAAEYGHSTFAQAAELAAEAGAKRLWLTHFSQTIPEPEALLPLAQERFPETVCGHDGLTIRLNFEEK